MSINMSYCRFENTLQALRECSDALADFDGPDPFDMLSDKEKKAAKKLLKLCGDLAADYGDDG